MKCYGTNNLFYNQNLFINFSYLYKLKQPWYRAGHRVEVSGESDPEHRSSKKVCAGLT